MTGRIRPARTVRYTDEVLADGMIHRRYDDGRVEWRTRVDDTTVTWQDNGGWRGTDERLADRVVKRTLADGRVLWGREQGFGRTAWEEGNIVTVNVSRLRGRAGWIAAAAGLALAAAAIVPARALSAAQERFVRGRRGGGGGGRRGGGGGDWDEDALGDDGDLWWDDHDDHDALDDFGELDGGLDDDFG